MPTEPTFNAAALLLEQTEYRGEAEFGIKCFSSNNPFVPWAGKFVLMYGEGADYEPFDTIDAALAVLCDRLKRVRGQGGNMLSTRLMVTTRTDLGAGP